MSEDKLETILDEAGWPKATLPFFGAGDVRFVETVYAPDPATLAASEFSRVVDVEAEWPPS